MINWRDIRTGTELEAFLLEFALEPYQSRLSIMQEMREWLEDHAYQLKLAVKAQVEIAETTPPRKKRPRKASTSRVRALS